ncbi:unnamed protein product [Ectocarpus sp. 12 AP-2014]
MRRVLVTFVPAVGPPSLSVKCAKIHTVISSYKRCPVGTERLRESCPPCWRCGSSVCDPELQGVDFYGPSGRGVQPHRNSRHRVPQGTPSYQECVECRLDSRCTHRSLGWLECLVALGEVEAD